MIRIEYAKEKALVVWRRQINNFPPFDLLTTKKKTKKTKVVVFYCYHGPSPVITVKFKFLKPVYTLNYFQNVIL
jgi:hypothetical protein